MRQKINENGTTAELDLHGPEGWDGEKNLVVTWGESQSWMDELEPLLSEEDRRLDADLVAGYHHYEALVREAERFRAGLQVNLPAWGTTLSLYHWARDIRDTFIADRQSTVMREAIVHGILERIANK